MHSPTGLAIRAHLGCGRDECSMDPFCLQQEFCVEFPDLKTVFGAYDLVSRYLRLPLSASDQVAEEEKGLFAPPQDVDGFPELARSEAAAAAW